MIPFFRDGGRKAIIDSHKDGIGFHHIGPYTFMAEKGKFGYWMSLYREETKMFSGPFGSWNLRAVKMDSRA